MPSSPVTRRKLLEGVPGVSLLAVTAQLLSPALFYEASIEAVSESTAAEQGKMADLARTSMQKYGVPGLSVSIGRAGTVAYQGAFKFADKDRHQSLSPENRFRIAIGRRLPIRGAGTPALTAILMRLYGASGQKLACLEI